MAPLRYSIVRGDWYDFRVPRDASHAGDSSKGRANGSCERWLLVGVLVSLSPLVLVVLVVVQLRPPLLQAGVWCCNDASDGASRDPWACAGGRVAKAGG
ncbi:hypothetical protein O9K51_07120 [Purpureocillium lavendulum]|uniref:Uncharacterized protein n=1 Tax=Purpureocillium lavendulum TaxID=1247861 RepID=A0AB34FPL5_9HYPO|nr:hypothetical protein O9K51_07120 [Purpureocillium lavendulum]